jgi:uncharacterized protein (DUF433 family)
MMLKPLEYEIQPATMEPENIAESMMTNPVRSWARSLQGTHSDWEHRHSFHIRLDDYSIPSSKSTDAGVLLSVRLTYGTLLLKECVDIDPDRMGGIPVLAGTRFPVAQVLGELADGTTVSKLAKNFNLDAELIASFLRGIAIHLDRPFSR